MCEIIDKSNANYIKTSTGFSTGGATFDDVKLMSEHIKNKKLKLPAELNRLMTLKNSFH